MRFSTLYEDKVAELKEVILAEADDAIASLSALPSDPSSPSPSPPSSSSSVARAAPPPGLAPPSSSSAQPFPPGATAFLTAVYLQKEVITSGEKRALADKLQLTTRQVENWFANKRARELKKASGSSTPRRPSSSSQSPYPSSLSLSSSGPSTVPLRRNTVRTVSSSSTASDDSLLSYASASSFSSSSFSEGDPLPPSDSASLTHSMAAVSLPAAPPPFIRHEHQHFDSPSPSSNSADAPSPAYSFDSAPAQPSFYLHSSSSSTASLSSLSSSLDLPTTSFDLDVDFDPTPTLASFPHPYATPPPSERAASPNTLFHSNSNWSSPTSSTTSYLDLSYSSSPSNTSNRLSIASIQSDGLSGFPFIENDPLIRETVFNDMLTTPFEVEEDWGVGVGGVVPMDGGARAEGEEEEGVGMEF
ncbi:hypothetical protein MNV49_000781 [Pseudohyphozyma bogoriensis]|nr:hypothetical protein MNV49_000781 [Pseudohyphozyma bogoriensis]